MGQIEQSVPLKGAPIMSLSSSLPQILEKALPGVPLAAAPTARAPEEFDEMRRLEPAPLTQAQRRSIKTALDNYFDDDKGQYLEGKSDQVIADSLNVPRLHVERMREAAYGPVRVKPELLALQKEILAVGDRITAAIASAEKAAETALGVVDNLQVYLRANTARLDKLKAMIDGNA